MKIFLKRALFLMCALTLVFGLVGCPTEPKNNNIGGGSEKPEEYGDYQIVLNYSDTPVIDPSAGDVKIYEGETLIDTIKAADETLVALNNSNGVFGAISVKNELVTVRDNSVIIVPHTDEKGYSLLKPATTYKIVISDGLITGTLTSSLEFTTRGTQTITDNVIKVGSAETDNFYTIQGALDFLRSNEATGDWTINVAEGEYHERLSYFGNANVTLVGPESEYGDKVLIYWTNLEAWNGSTRSRPTFVWQGGNLTLKNLTFQNTTDRNVVGKDKTQAETLNFDSKNYLVANNCSFLSHQDTLVLGNNGGRCWFYDCYIEGDTDFLWGTADVALFEECKLKCLDDSSSPKGNGTCYIFASRTVDTNPVNKGFVLINSEVEMEANTDVFYARNSGSDTQAIVLNNKFYGEGKLNSALYGSKPGKYVEDPAGDLAIGYKDYNNSLNGVLVDTSARLDGCGAISERVADREYNGRWVILNRGYSEKEGVYKTAETIWDISDYEAEFEATEDKSKENVFVDPVGSPRALVGGATVQLTAYSIVNANETFTWKSSDETLATVDANGLVTVKTGVEGNVTITATASSGKTDIAIFDIIPTFIEVDTIAISGTETMSLYGYGTATVALTGTEGGVPSDPTVTYTTDDPSIIRFIEDGVYVDTITTTAGTVNYATVKDGTAKIIATSTTEGKGAELAVTVDANSTVWVPEIAGIIVNTDVQSGTYGAFYGAMIDSKTLNNEGGKSGKMGMKAGNERMQCRNILFSVPVTKDCEIKVTLTGAPAANSGMVADGANIIWDESTLTYTVKFDYDSQAVTLDGTGILFANKGDKNQTIDFTGKFAQLAFQYTDCYISKIERVDGDFNYTFQKSETYDVAVAFDDTSDVELDLASETPTVTRVATVSGADADKVEVEYSSNNVNVVTVDGNGVVTAVGKGTATITASVNTNSFGTEKATSSYNVKVVKSSTAGSPVTVKWDFYNSTEAKTIEGSTDTVASDTDGYVANIDATSGKLAIRVGNWAQFNAGTKITIPVTAGTVVTVANYDANYSIDGVAATEKDTTVTANADGTMVIESTGGSYIGSITAVYPPVVEPVTVKWDFYNSTEAKTIEGSTDTVASDTDGYVANIDATSGKLAIRVGNWAQFNAGTKITIPVTAGTVVTVANYDANYSIDGVAATEKDTTVTANADGTMVIESTGGSYIGSITAVYKTPIATN